MRDARTQLFDAAERILVRDGPSALTSRAVTGEAGCAKGVLHRHFADFDDFLAELVRDRIARLETLRPVAGTGTVAENVTDALTALFRSVAVAIVALVTSRRELLERLRATTATGVPLLTEATAMIASYLAEEQALGRVAGDVSVLAPTLVGSAHLLASEPDELRKVVASLM
jgi:AcrR family transcriptional regulator